MVRDEPDRGRRRERGLKVGKGWVGDPSPLVLSSVAPSITPPGGEGSGASSSHCSTNCGTASPATAFSAAFFFFFADLGFADVFSSFCKRRMRNVVENKGTAGCGGESGKAHLDVKILDLLLGLDDICVEGQARDFVGAVGHEQNGELELGHMLACAHERLRR